MPKAVPLPPAGFDDLSVDEKLDYLQSLWDRITASPEARMARRFIVRPLAEAISRTPRAGTRRSAPGFRRGSSLMLGWRVLTYPIVEVDDIATTVRIVGQHVPRQWMIAVTDAEAPAVEVNGDFHFERRTVADCLRRSS